GRLASLYGDQQIGGCGVHGGWIVLLDCRLEQRLTLGRIAHELRQLDGARRMARGGGFTQSRFDSAVVELRGCAALTRSSVELCLGVNDSGGFPRALAGQSRIQLLDLALWVRRPRRGDAIAPVLYAHERHVGVQIALRSARAQL